MSKLALGLAVTLVALYGGACLLLFVFQRSLIYLPPRSRPAVAEGVTKLRVATGGELQVSVREVSGSRALLYFGGNAEDVSWSLPALARFFPDHSLYLWFYPGYAGAAGAPSEEALHAGARTLFAQVSERYPEVTVLGRSLGSGVAVRLAAEQPVARLILVTPYDSLAELGAGFFPWLPVRLLQQDRFESVELAPRLDVPTLFVIAEHDEVIPRAHSRRLFEAFRPGVARWVVVPGAGHNSISEREEYWMAVRAGGEDSPR